MSDSMDIFLLSIPAHSRVYLTTVPSNLAELLFLKYFKNIYHVDIHVIAIHREYYFINNRPISNCINEYGEQVYYCDIFYFWKDLFELLNLSEQAKIANNIIFPNNDVINCLQNIRLHLYKLSHGIDLDKMSIYMKIYSELEQISNILQCTIMESLMYLLLLANKFAIRCRNYRLNQHQIEILNPYLDRFDPFQTEIMQKLNSKKLLDTIKQYAQIANSDCVRKEFFDVYDSLEDYMPNMHYKNLVKKLH